jgi:antitoxin HicB
MGQTYRVPLRLDPEPDGAITVTSPLLPELVTAGDTVSEALANVRDALIAVFELYEDTDRPLPPQLWLDVQDDPVAVDYVVSVA